MGNNILKSKDLKKIKKWINNLVARKTDPKRNRRIVREKLKLSYKELSVGGHRIVYDIKNGLVLKVAFSKQGIRCNEIEANLYKTVDSSAKSYLAAVKDYGLGWIIMEKIEDEISNTEINRTKLLKIHKRFSKVGVDAKDIIHREKKEIKLHNIRYRKKDDSIIIIDYGNFEYLN